MKTTLIYNPSAGGSNTVASVDLEAALCAIGLEAIHRPTTSEDDLEQALENPGDLVVVAGGDGSVRAVASHLAGRGVPLTVLPMGTANNIGAALGLTGPPLELIVALEQPRRRWLDLGRVQGPWGEKLFLEGAGVGLFASVMAAYGPDDGKSPLRALTAGVQTITAYVAPDCHLTLDGVLRSDRCLLVEAMNTPAIGPRLRLAPDADPSDGWLEVITISDDGYVCNNPLLSGQKALPDRKSMPYRPSNRAVPQKWRSSRKLPMVSWIESRGRMVVRPRKTAAEFIWLRLWSSPDVSLSVG